MKVWIDQDLCTGDGLCEEIAPAVFTLLDDGLAYVKEGDKVFSTRAAPRVSPTSPTACSTPSSSPPRNAPASASSSRPSSPLLVGRPARWPVRSVSTVASGVHSTRHDPVSAGCASRAARARVAPLGR